MKLRFLIVGMALFVCASIASAQEAMTEELNVSETEETLAENNFILPETEMAEEAQPLQLYALAQNVDDNDLLRLYTIDISTESGRLKLNKLSIDEASDLALIEAIRANKCATIFQPKFTHLVEKGKVLRVTLYGFPARYKKKQ